MKAAVTGWRRGALKIAIRLALKSYEATIYTKNDEPGEHS